jgi:hypothetical protein
MYNLAYALLEESIISMTHQRDTHLQVLISSLLPLAVHGAGWLATEGADGDEQDEAGDNSHTGVGEDPPALSRGILGTGSVGTEGDVVSYSSKTQSVNGSNDISKLHAPNASYIRRHFFFFSRSNL